MQPFRVALNGRFSGTLQPTGMQVAAFHLFDAIVRARRDFELVIFADPAFVGVAEWALFDRVKLVPTLFSEWSRVKSQLWEQAVLPFLLKKERCDVVHHPITTCPRWGFGVPSVVTVHDLGFFHRPDWVEPSFRRWMLATAVPGIRAATRVVTISDYVLADARQTLGLAADRSSRIYNGLARTIRPALPGSGVQPVPFRLLGVNLWQPHKNLVRLLDAVALLKAEFPTLELHLAGRPQARYRHQPELAERLKAPGVQILGYLSDDDLASAYHAASVFVFPSLEEGFGLPVLEAMASGTPVVTSNASCLPEIAGDAAVLVDPFSVESLAAGLKQALTESGEARAARIARGQAVAAKFSWAKSAQDYIQLYRAIAR